MLYYGEEQELSSEEISEKMVLAQKMLEEIRHHQPFFTQRELVDEEADEAHECRCIQFLVSSTSLLSLWSRRGQHLVEATNSQYSELFGMYLWPQGYLTVRPTYLDPTFRAFEKQLKSHKESTELLLLRRRNRNCDETVCSLC